MWTRRALLVLVFAAGLLLSVFLRTPKAEAGACYGYRPLPPPMCRVMCICDRFGLRCSWEVVC